jgi:hypothetical protein
VSVVILNKNLIVMKKGLMLRMIGLACLLYLCNVSVAQHPFPPDRFPVKVNGTVLEINDCSGRRFFLAGMVDNIPNTGLQLSMYDHDEMENQFLYHKAIGATAMRWNAFLRGKDLRWDANGYVTGMCDNAVANLKDGCDLAYKHGMVLQIVLSTAHWLRYGAGGETPENVTRVNNNRFMFEDTVATQAYIDNVIKPITQAIGVHPGLFGYLIINEASGMFYSEDAGLGTWSNVKVHMADFQRWVNRVASEIRTNQPGAILSVSGVAPGLSHFCDSVLITRGGRSNGTLDINQIQFYPSNHRAAWSPFLHTPEVLFNSFGGDLKPIICGETPIEAKYIEDGNGIWREEFGLEEAYTALWNNGHSGGFTWSNRVYETRDPAEQAVIDAAYTNFYNNYLVNNDFDGSKCAGHLYATPVIKTVSKSAGSHDLIIISDKSWAASSDAGWCTLSSSSGSNIDTISVSRTMNTGTERTANITLSASGVSDYVVSVLQEGAFLHVSPFTETVGRSGGTVNLTVTSNLSNWSVSSDAGWCTPSPSSGSNNDVVVVSYSDNTGEERVANLTFSVSGAPDVIVTITQEPYIFIGVFQQDSGSDKIVSMEAEHYHDNVDGSGDYSTHRWIVTTSPGGYSGNSAMVTNPNNSTNISSASDAEAYAPTLKYVVNFLTTGTHYIWLRVNTNGSGGDNSIHAGLNGTISAERLEGGISSDWVWKSYKSDGNRPTINVPSTGEHTFCLFMREDGMRVDKIVLTTNIDYVPTGNGPAESGQSGVDPLTVTPTSNNEFSLNIFPNPGSGNIHLDFGSNKVEDVQISILNMTGQQLISETYKSVQLGNGIDLSLEGIKNGIYLIQCKIAGQTQSVKFVKN